MKKTIIELTHNGDPYGNGFVGSQSDDNENLWFYRGDLGPKTRNWWRMYCQYMNYILREVR